MENIIEDDDDGNLSDLEEQLRELEVHPLEDDNEEIVLEEVRNEVVDL